MSLRRVVPNGFFSAWTTGLHWDFLRWEKVSQGIHNLGIIVPSISLLASVTFDSILACYVFVRLVFFFLRLESVFRVFYCISF